MIDGHAHLNEIEKIDEALDRARDAGVEAVLAVGMDLQSNAATLSLADRCPGFVLPAVGYHPWSIQAGQVEANLGFIRRNIHRCTALGEVGLDYGAKAKKPLQRDVFEKLLGIANAADRPVIIHCRYSHARALAMVLEARVARAVFHWYSGPLDVLEGILAGGHCVSATPALTRSPAHRAAMEAAPIDRILVETDCPVAYNGKPSEPADLTITLRELARMKGLSFEETARITEANFRRFYQLEA